MGKEQIEEIDWKREKAVFRDGREIVADKIETEKGNIILYGHNFIEYLEGQPYHTESKNPESVDNNRLIMKANEKEKVISSEDFKEVDFEEGDEVKAKIKIELEKIGRFSRNYTLKDYQVIEDNGGVEWLKKT